jgi:tetratricopeptide (TPR) repeat protein
MKYGLVDRVLALRVKGMVLTRQARWGEAAATFEEALALARRPPYPCAEASILFEYGLLHAGKGQPEQARKTLADALAGFRRLGAKQDLGRVERALAELGARESPLPPKTADASRAR